MIGFALLLSLGGICLAADNETVLFDAKGFEPPDYTAGEKANAKLIGQNDWEEFPGGGAGNLMIVTRNRVVDGKASIRCLSRATSGASHAIDFEPGDKPTELVVRFLLGNSERDDAGNAVVGITGSKDKRDFASFMRVGSTDRMRTFRPRNGKEKQAATSDKVDAQGPFEVELVFRVFPGKGDDRAAARFRKAGEEQWQTIAFHESANPDAEGFVDLGADVPTETLLVFISSDGKSWRAAVRVDNLVVVSRPAPEGAKPGKASAAGPASTPAAAETEPARSTPVSDASFPDDAGVIDVTQPPYGATGDGKTDDTAAIQKALDDWPSGNRIIYLPKGTYRVTDTLRWGTGGKGREQKRIILQGRAQDQTVIRLADSSDGFQDASKRRAVIWTGNKPAQRFRNSIRDLTIDTGSGNPGACGVQYNTSNQGTMRNVTIRSGDGQGVAGLDLYYTTEIGNGLITNVTIHGFDYGVRTRDRVNGVVFENLTLKNQNKTAIWNEQQVLSINGLTSHGNVPVIRNNEGGVIAMINAKLHHTSPDSELTAITNDKSTLYLRNVDLNGFTVAVANNTGTKREVREAHIDEYASHDPIALFGTQPKGLGLPTKLAPNGADVPIDQWVSPDAFGAAGDGQTDDTAALQKAIDTGKPVVYLPAGRKYRIDGELIVRGRVERITGTEGSVTGKGTIRVVDGDTPAVVIERLEWGYGGTELDLIHDTSRTVVVRNAMLPRIVGKGSGDLFVDDVSNHKWRKHDQPMLELLNPNQHVWCRNIDPENYGSAKIVNRGATLWILGLKTENHNICLVTSDGGKTEVIGGHLYAQNKAKTRPAFVVTDSSLSVAAVRQYDWKQSRWFEQVVAATRGEQTETVARKDTPLNAMSLFAVQSP
jgi:hypothetical protein